jgi:uncharacterized BrkB/YihY/UPF0761 family membrane protein
MSEKRWSVASTVLGVFMVPIMIIGTAAVGSLVYVFGRLLLGATGIVDSRPWYYEGMAVFVFWWTVFGLIAHYYRPPKAKRKKEHLR